MFQNSQGTYHAVSKKNGINIIDHIHFSFHFNFETFRYFNDHTFKSLISNINLTKQNLKK